MIAAGANSRTWVLRGFTLLEMLVVLVLVALATGLIAPMASRWLDAAQQRAWQDDLRAQLQGLPLRAFHSGKPVRLDAQAVGQLVPDMPADVVVELSEPLHYGPTGAARAAEIRLRRSGAAALVWRVIAVTGEVQG